MLSRLHIAALWSPAGKGMTSWPLLVMFNRDFVNFSCVIVSQVWYLIVSIPDLCRLSYFDGCNFAKPSFEEVIIGRMCVNYFEFPPMILVNMSDKEKKSLGMTHDARLTPDL